MKAGHASQTAVIVCMGRAVAHGATPVAKFSDPTALTLLPDDARARVERFRSGTGPRGLRARLAHGFLDRQSKLMIARTVAIDDAVRGSRAPQLVVLGAGLDGRAWRMPELRDVIVFEVDHPDTQRDKRERASRLVQTARQVRFVPVDFERDVLDEALASAGHDPTLRTIWIWEGVMMYLTSADVESTLEVIERRSAEGSRLIVGYAAPAIMLWVTGLLTRRVGEPLRSAYRADEMRLLLSRHEFDIVRDEDLPTIAASLSTDLVRPLRFLTYFRIATAVRRPEVE